MKISNLTILFLLFLGGCITILPPRKVDDGSTSLTSSDSSSVHHFNLTNVNSSAKYEEKSSLPFEFLNAENIAAIFKTINMIIL
jgi:hypothetical protein